MSQKSRKIVQAGLISALLIGTPVAAVLPTFATSAYAKEEESTTEETEETGNTDDNKDKETGNTDDNKGKETATEDTALPVEEKDTEEAVEKSDETELPETSDIPVQVAGLLGTGGLVSFIGSQIMNRKKH